MSCHRSCKCWLPVWTQQQWPAWMVVMVVLLLLPTAPVTADMSDADQADTTSDTSSTSDMQTLDDSSDPNLLNPQRGQGYGVDGNPRWSGAPTTVSPRKPVAITPQPTFSEQSLRAVLELGIIVGVAFMVGGLFMAMVGMEILCDKMVDRYREFFKKPKQLPDVERLHPAELVGTFSRYK